MATNTCTQRLENRICEWNSQGSLASKLKLNTDWGLQQHVLGWHIATPFSRTTQHLKRLTLKSLMSPNTKALASGSWGASWLCQESTKWTLQQLKGHHCFSLTRSSRARVATWTLRCRMELPTASSSVPHLGLADDRNWTSSWAPWHLTSVSGSEARVPRVGKTTLSINSDCAVVNTLHITQGNSQLCLPPGRGSFQPQHFRGNWELPSWQLYEFPSGRTCP